MESHTVEEMQIGKYYLLNKGNIAKLYYKFHFDQGDGGIEVHHGCHFNIFSPREGYTEDLFLIDSWHHEYECIDIERLKIIPEIYIKKNIPKELIDIIYSYIF